MDSDLNKTVIVDYEAGNLRSVANMLKFLDIPYEITSDGDKIYNAKRIIFPGQGHFAQAMNNLHKKELVEVIKQSCKKGIPFLGICIGLQILFEKSEEAPGVEGLGIFKGEVKRYANGKVPQIGWSKVTTTDINKYIPDEYFYFVNSYYVVPEMKNIESAIGYYYVPYCAAVQYENITAVQFHPEKSAKAGLTFFKNWFNLF